ncbi:syntaxin-11-like isoform X2 [Sardina pilchardus]
MRDRLSHLQALSESEEHLAELEESEYGDDVVSVGNDTLSSVDLQEEEEEIRPQAVVWARGGEEVEEVLQEAQEVRREVQLMRVDVRRLREQNGRLLSEPTRTTAVKRDSNAIGADIKTRGQDVLASLRKMDARARTLEDEHGVNSAVARIARTQYACLSNGFRDAMTDYNEAEMSHRDAVKAHIRRQMEIVGTTDVSGEQMEDMLEAGRWNVFADNVLAEGKTARAALGQIERRHRELLELESRVRGVHEVFLDVAVLVEEQGPMMDTILAHVQKTDAQLADAIVRLTKAKKHDKSNPCKQMFCGCFPCYK